MRRARARPGAAYDRRGVDRGHFLDFEDDVGDVFVYHTGEHQASMRARQRSCSSASSEGSILYFK